MQLMLPLHVYESWSLYVIDINNKHMLVMDPCETSEPLNELIAKHGSSVAKILAGLRHGIQARDASELQEVRVSQMV
jgi:hypothetical protein